MAKMGESQPSYPTFADALMGSSVTRNCIGVAYRPHHQQRRIGTVQRGELIAREINGKTCFGCATNHRVS